MISQINLVSEILNILVKNGYKDALPRQINIVIKAANEILAEFEKPFHPATPNMGIWNWLACDEAGLSSKYMAYKLCDTPVEPYAFPQDSDDFGRCLKFLEAVTKRRDLQEMKLASREWEKLVGKWFLLVELYEKGFHERIYEELQEMREM